MPSVFAGNIARHSSGAVRNLMTQQPQRSAKTHLSLPDDSIPAPPLIIDAVPSSAPTDTEVIDSGSQRDAGQPFPVEAACVSTYELPSKYGENRVTLLVRDPGWLYAYWEHIGMPCVQDALYKSIVRLYMADGSGAYTRIVIDIPVEVEAGNWYVNVPSPNASYVAELGHLYNDGTFLTLARSNIVFTPPASVSNVEDEEWATSECGFLYLYTRGLVRYMEGSEEHLKGKMVLPHLLENISSPMV